MTPEERLARFLDGGEDEREGAFVTEALAAASTWDGPPPDLEQLVVDAVRAEAGSQPRRRWVGLGGIAAGLLLVAAALLFLRDEAEPHVLMAATDLAPTASAVATIIDTPGGVLIRLEVGGLPPAPEGSYYQGWVRNEQGDSVSIGTFHMRGGEGRIGLWSGVSLEEYPTISVSLQKEGEGTESSGRVFLQGTYRG